MLVHYTSGRAEDFDLRGDHSTYADGLLDDIKSIRGIAVLENIAADMCRLLREPLQEARGEQDFSSCIWLCFAVLPCDEGSNVFLVGEQELVPGSEDAGAFSTRLCTPCWESLLACVDCSLTILLDGLWTCSDFLFCRGIC